uniref:Uncharacterized protein n=1 Tax=Amphimedon queenslandica TaxID=400682 RepID=A0A1X7TZA7_AMPQE
MSALDDVASSRKNAGREGFWYQIELHFTRKGPVQSGRPDPTPAAEGSGTMLNKTLCSQPSSKRLRLDPVTTPSRSNSKQQPSTSVSITLDYPAGTRSYHLTPRRMQYGKTLARCINCAKSLAKHALKDPEAKKWLLNGF